MIYNLCNGIDKDKCVIVRVCVTFTVELSVLKHHPYYTSTRALFDCVFCKVYSNKRKTHLWVYLISSIISKFYQFSTLSISITASVPFSCSQYYYYGPINIIIIVAGL